MLAHALEFPAWSFVTQSKRCLHNAVSPGTQPHAEFHGVSSETPVDEAEELVSRAKMFSFEERKLKGTDGYISSP